MKETNILIYGSGAVGSIIGWRLSRHAHNKVSVVCRSNFDAVRSHGLEFRTSAWGNGRFIPHRVFRAGDLPSIQGQPYDYVVFANKGTDNESHRDIVRDLDRLVDVNTTLVSARNGMDTEVPLRRAFSKNTVLSAICNVGCSQIRPGFVSQNAGMNPKAFQIGVFGSSVHGSFSDRVRRDALVAFDERFGAVDDIVRQRWRKLIFNTVWNATSALSNLDTHQALKRSDTLHLAGRLAEEACTVSDLCGAGLDQNYKHEVITLAQQAEAITPSTLQDVRAKRVLEVAPIWGYLVRRAAEFGADVPVLTLVRDALEQLSAAFNTERMLVMQQNSRVQRAMDSSLQSPLHATEQWIEDRVPTDEQLRLLGVSSAIAVA